MAKNLIKYMISHSFKLFRSTVTHHFWSQNTFLKSSKYVNNFSKIFLSNTIVTWKKKLFFTNTGLWVGGEMKG
jgi:hypothetical protein